MVDALSGLHFFWPEIRGHLRGSPVEKSAPSGDASPGTTPEGGLLRTGELLKIRFHQSKTGLRTGAQEAVAIRYSQDSLENQTSPMDYSIVD